MAPLLPVAPPRSMTAAHPFSLWCRAKAVRPHSVPWRRAHEQHVHQRRRGDANKPGTLVQRTPHGVQPRHRPHLLQQPGQARHNARCEGCQGGRIPAALQGTSTGCKELEGETLAQAGAAGAAGAAGDAGDASGVLEPSRRQVVQATQVMHRMQVMQAMQAVRAGASLPAHMLPCE